MPGVVQAKSERAGGPPQAKHTPQSSLRTLCFPNTCAGPPEHLCSPATTTITHVYGSSLPAMAPLPMCTHVIVRLVMGAHGHGA